jgi:hypothetical protein
VWKELLYKYYLGKKNAFLGTSQTNKFPFWKELMSVKDEFFDRGSLVAGDKVNIHFWKDVLAR